MEKEPRTVVLDAVVRLVADEGLDAVSVRRVATGADVSIGMVQHHFPTKDALLLGAMETVSAAFARRAGEAVSVADTPPDEVLRALVAELLPLDAVRRDEGRVWLAFVARAAVTPALREVHARDWQKLEDGLAGLLVAHRRRGTDDHEQPEDRADARLLLAVLDGLAIGGLVETRRLAPDRIRAVVDPLLDGLLDRAPQSPGRR